MSTKSVKLTEVTREMLRVAASYTGETVQQVAERVVRAELERLKVNPPTKEQKIQKEIKHRKHRGRAELVRNADGTPRLLVTVPAKG